ncbi:anthranilate synthase component I [Marinitenerispora sediminis]|uniref:Anthranilate synthase n=1 Tax=Marinitenerispora sediminis TaxID=1931232 RepID=A0A368SYA3_9ACTN|nr:anthranilate synthase component I [Marinitenerispora sediminis]RCV48776.1 anthranilate synthase component I [Marinitenerispora sediminis]RCV51769.1 anthranilate synthase component I [Marinitenerispora sediminis]RCV57646.1 anthranilate synthase component I [Marinitenerispora sediminis]
MDDSSRTYRTAGGIAVRSTATPCDPGVLTELTAAVERRRGGVLSSGMEYPGRYSRWHLGYVDPCLEVVARGRRVTASALNERGAVLLPVVARALLEHGRPAEPAAPDRAPAYGVVDVTIPEPAAGEYFTEEQRSRRPSVFSALRSIVALFAGPEDPHLGLYGAFGYDLAFQFEPIEQRLPRDPDDRDLVLQLPDEIVVHDRKRETCVRNRYEFTVPAELTGAGEATTEGLPRRTEPTPAVSAREVPPPPEPGSYAAIVADAKERFVRGDLFEVVPSHRTYGACDSPARFYERLRERNPAPYEFFLNLGEGEYLVGASPEMFVRVTGAPGEGQRVETCPISGTIRRGEDALGDADNIRALLSSPKEESELTMCTDVDRNDKSRVCEPGSVRVIGRRQIEMYSRLIHTVDHIEGRLRPEFDALDAFLTHMWAVTVTGAPKTWAMRFIETHETTPRRWYGGAVGVIAFDGSMNTGLTLRTAHIRDGVATVRVGATLLYDSDPDAEERETFLKARALLETLAEDSGGRPAADAGRPAAAPAAEQPAGEGMRVLLVDFEDSFVNTLADYFRRHEAEVTTLRHGFDPARLDELAPDLVVLSPGPGLPSDFGTAALLDELDRRRLPVFGVCLGLQAMVEHAGGELCTLAEPVHGKPSLVRATGGELLAGIGAGADGDTGEAAEGEFTAARYHSTYTTPDRVKNFTVTAVVADGAEPVVMAIEDPRAKRWAVQFHPESILTAAVGERVVANVLRLAR